MRDQNFSFFGPDIMSIGMANRDNPCKAFDWDKAAQIIKEKLIEHPDLTAEAGLDGDWSYTGGVIFTEGHAIVSDYTYLSSTWATPKLLLIWDGQDQEEIDCFCEANERFDSDSKWDAESLKILGRGLKELPE